ncbi:MAG: hypothetical protein WCQ86_02870 [Bacteroidaceae bacterium]
MKKLFLKSPFIILLTFLFWGAFVSCDDENFSTSSSDQPFFSTDTLSFDTLITTIGSSTKKVMLRNPSKKSLRITSLTLKGGSSSVFRVNCDGQAGTEFTNLELMDGDSMYLFVEVTVPEQNSVTPQLIEDEIEVLTNGTTQHLLLQAVGQDAQIMRGRILTRDTTFTSGKPILIYDSLYVTEGTTLTCLEGTRMLFHDKASLKVAGTLITEGSAEQRVEFRGDRFDNLFSYLPYDRTPGLWEGIFFLPSSVKNVLNGVNVHSAINALTMDAPFDYTVETPFETDAPYRLRILNSIIHNSSATDLKLSGSKVEILNSQLTNAGGDIILLTNGNYRLLHCTILNEYAFALQNGYPIHIKGTFSGVIATRVTLQNCLYADAKKSFSFSDSGTYELISDGCAADADDQHYLNINNGRKYRYDFRPTVGNAGVGVGTSEWADEVPFDLSGLDRPSNAADAGCLQHADN